MAKTLSLEDMHALTVIKRNVRMRLQQLGLSTRSASIMAGKSKHWLGSWLSEESTVDPGTVALTRLASVLETDMAYLVSEDSELPLSDASLTQASDALESAKRLMKITNAEAQQAADLLNRRKALEILDLWLETGGLVDGRFQHLMPHLDLLAPRADNLIPEVIHLGRNSLAATSLESRDPDALINFMSNLSKDALEELGTSLHSVLNTGRGTVATPRRKIELSEGTTSKDIRFARLHLGGVIETPNKGHRRVVINVAHLVQRFYDDAKIPSLVIPD